MEEMSAHALARRQQRLDPVIFRLLMEFGEPELQRGKGATYVSFSSRKKRRKLLKCLRTAVEALDSKRNFFAIEANGTIVTCGHQYRRRLRSFDHKRGQKK